MQNLGYFSATEFYLCANSKGRFAACPQSKIMEKGVCNSFSCSATSVFSFVKRGVCSTKKRSKATKTRQSKKLWEEP